MITLWHEMTTVTQAILVVMLVCHTLVLLSARRWWFPQRISLAYALLVFYPAFALLSTLWSAFRLASIVAQDGVFDAQQIFYGFMLGVPPAPIGFLAVGIFVYALTLGLHLERRQPGAREPNHALQRTGHGGPSILLVSSCLAMACR